jgi:hypothetical protein
MPVAANNETAATVARSDFFISHLLWWPLVADSIGQVGNVRERGPFRTMDREMLTHVETNTFATSETRPRALANPSSVQRL